MTLRLALLLVSLIILGLIGLICHQKYRRSGIKKRPNDLVAEMDDSSELEQQVNTPFFTENIVSDIPAESSAVLQPAEDQPQEESQSPTLTTSLQELMDNKRIAQQLAEQMLPEYDDNDFITEHVAVIPNVNNTVKQINKVTLHLMRDSDREIEVFAAVKNRQEFVPIFSLKDKTKVRHLKTVLQLKDNKGVVDEKQLEQYQQFVEKLANQFACEYKFALDDAKQVADVCVKLSEFIKDHDQITILYILAQPDDAFSGEALKAAATAAGLELGEFDFFHLVSSTETNQGDKVYSLANMYKPGSFSLELLDKFSTTGLCAFMVPALLKDPVSGFREMCTSCKYIADQLNGVLTTNRRELLDEDNYIAICSDITAHKDKLNAAGVVTGSELAQKLFA